MYFVINAHVIFIPYGVYNVSNVTSTGNQLSAKKRNLYLPLLRYYKLAFHIPSHVLLHDAL
jgi:hypothetical protein